MLTLAGCPTVFGCEGRQTPGNTPVVLSSALSAGLRGSRGLRPGLTVLSNFRGPTDRLGVFGRGVSLERRQGQASRNFEVRAFGIEGCGPGPSHDGEPGHGASDCWGDPARDNVFAQLCNTDDIVQHKFIESNLSEVVKDAVKQSAARKVRGHSSNWACKTPPPLHTQLTEW
jgi:hypothetical protein